METSTTPLAYSYTRFSSAKQSGGDSFRRQTETAAAWAKKEGLTLDTSLRDLGVSGFGGRNAKVGALQSFLKAIKEGRVAPGSVLVLEDLDRLSRDVALLALTTLQKITDAGVDVVTLMDGKRYTRTSIYEVSETLTLVILFSRGHEESKKKSLRLKEVWQQKRKNAAALKTPMISKAPRWLTVTGGKVAGEQCDWKRIKYEPNEHAETVRQIFKWSIGGWGYRRIAAELIRLKVAPWVKAQWTPTSVSRIITSRATVGEFQLHKMEGGQYGKRVPDGEPVKDYYPRIVSDETWEAAQSTITQHRSGVSGMAMLAGLCIDPDGEKMYYVNSGGLRYVATHTLRRNSHRWSAGHLEQSVLAVATGIDWQRVFTDRAQEPERIRLEKEIADLNRLELKTKEQADRVVELMLDSGKTVGEALKKKAAQLDAQIAEIQAKRTAARAGLDRQRRTAAGISGAPLAKTVPKTPEAMERLREELRSRLSKIQVWPYGRPPSNAWKNFIDQATEEAPARSLLSRASGKVMGAIRLTFSNGKAITAFVTYVSRARSNLPPYVLGFADPEGMTAKEWNDYQIDSGFGGVGSDATVELTDAA